MQQVFELAVLKCHERFSVDMALTPDLSSFKFVYDERDVDLTGNVESSRFFHMIGNIDLVKTIDGAALEAAPAPTIVPAAASSTARPFITTPWKIGSEVECEFSEGNLRTAFIRSITTSFATVWSENTANPLIGETYTVPLSALRPIGWSDDADADFDELFTNVLINSDRDRHVETASGHCGATAFGRQVSSDRFASDAEYAKISRTLAAAAFENHFHFWVDKCGTPEYLKQSIEMHRRVANAESCSPEDYFDDSDFIALANALRRPVYIVLFGSCNVRVIVGGAVPNVVHLKYVMMRSASTK